jgi:hypothetical protein
MSFDAWIVAFGLSKLLKDLHLVDGAAAYLVLAGVIVLDAWLLYRFFAVHAAAESAPAPGYVRPETAHPD